ncbi:carbohydrate ABC transporter permease [Clostridium lacusfryxellense]|uniref:carbohydrate ABC transporter permease n=1 Tax=Clostridium lacusfryxellense TaxID=205328 RepID=UPI001C0D7FD4|nr:carbohydrate ABC transporter permease [Clostridium lacusfryxellense]MBU3113277.1 carbohydrate ABC transporter permease [Clostridium lacusfryxellense]
MIEKIISKPLGFLVNVMVFLFSVTCVFPLIWVIYSSLKTQQEFSLNIISLPKGLQFSNYIEAFKIGKMQIYFLNSMFNSIVAVSCIMFIAFITAYALARYKFKGRDLIYSMFMVGMLIPIQSLLVPVFVEFKTFGLLDNRITLLLPYIAFGLPMAIFLIESFIKTIPIYMKVQWSNLYCDLNNKNSFSCKGYDDDNEIRIR